MARSDLIVWIDLEMTGLDPEQHRIIEIATLLTDANLLVVAEGPELIIHQPNDVLERMNSWCVENHAKSGLTERVRSSTVSERSAEEQTLAFVTEHCVAGTSPLGGNSVHLDHGFLQRHMPELTAHLKPDGILDVTTMKELVRRWYPDVLAKAPKKSDSHRALEDIRESVKELSYYRDRVLL